MVGPISATYAAVNRGKQAVKLNLKDPADRDRFYDLARQADVVVEGFRPGVIDKLGIGYDKLREINPRIVLCSISGYGQHGPYAQRAGHDLNYQALAGVLSIAGGGSHGVTPESAIAVADTAAGSYAAAMLVLAAVLKRQQTGRGRHIDVSMSEQLLPMMTTLYAAADAVQRDPHRDGELLSGGAPCYRIFRTKDDRYVTIGSLEPKFWLTVVERLGVPDLAGAAFHGGPDAEKIAARVGKSSPLGRKPSGWKSSATRTPASSRCRPLARWPRIRVASAEKFFEAAHPRRPHASGSTEDAGHAGRL